MTLNIIPTQMRARHHESHIWQTLHLDVHNYLEQPLPASDLYYIDTGDEPIWADLHDFDRFEAT